MGAYDNLFSKLFEDAERAGKVLRAVLPGELVSKLDETKPPVAIHKQIAISSERHGVCDGLFRFARKDPKGGSVVTLVEHKSFPDPSTPLQLMFYTSGLLSRDGFAANDGTNRWTPVYSVVFYGSVSEWNVGDVIFDMSVVDLSLEEASLRFRYQLVDLARIDIGSLDLELDSLSALQVLALHGATSKMISDDKLDLIAGGFAKSDLGSYICENIFHLIDVLPERMEAAEQRVNPRKKERLMPTLGERYAERGRQEGLQKGRAEALLDLLRLKFKTVPEMRREQVLAAGIEELAAWNGAILTAQSVDEVFAGRPSA